MRGHLHIIKLNYGIIPTQLINCFLCHIITPLMNFSVNGMKTYQMKTEIETLREIIGNTNIRDKLCRRRTKINFE